MHDTKRDAWQVMVLAAIIVMTSGVPMAGCSLMLRTDEYVPLVLSELNALGVFEDSPEIVLGALEQGSIPPSWQIASSDLHWTLWKYPPAMSIGPVGHLPDGCVLGSATITPVITKDSFLEIKIAASRGNLPLVHQGYAVIHARSRSDARIVASGKTLHDVKAVLVKESRPPPD